MTECKQKTQKQFYVRFKKIKDLSLLGTGRVICAKNKESAKSKFIRQFPLSPKPKITGVTELRWKEKLKKYWNGFSGFFGELQ